MQWLCEAAGLMQMFECDKRPANPGVRRFCNMWKKMYGHCESGDVIH